MSHIFISYNRLSVDFVNTLDGKLKEQSFNTWVDSELALTQNWVQGIEKAIQEAFLVLAVMTPKAKESEYVTYEWSYALGHNIPVAVLMLEMVELHPRLQHYQYIDFATPSQIQRPWPKLYAEIRRIQHEFEEKRVSKQQAENDRLAEVFFEILHTPRRFRIEIRTIVDTLIREDLLPKSQHQAFLDAILAHEIATNQTPDVGELFSPPSQSLTPPSAKK
jgi:hypothetical protein